jgi:hypothetical protein
MNKLLLLIYFLPFSLSAQSLKIGLKASAPISANLSTVKELNYYYADDRNSAYTLNPDKGLEKRFVVFPRLFAQYMLNDNFLVGYEAGYSTFLKKFAIRANNNFKNNLVLDTYYDYSFFSNSLYVGYKFLRTREIHPKLFTGITHLALLRMEEVTNRSEEYHLKNIDPYGKVIHQQVNGFSNSFFAHTLGFGIEYYILTVDITYDYAISALEKNTPGSLYKNYHLFSFSAGINLLGVLPGVGKVKNAANFNK